jgi:hypothetical protein
MKGYDKSGVSCPKCKRLMVALFQTPRCEHCELGGPELPRYWCTAIRALIERDGVYGGACFKDSAKAKFWAKFSRSERAVDIDAFECQVYAPGLDIPFRWRQVDEKDHVIFGAWHCAVGIAFDERAAQRYAMGHGGLSKPLLVMVKA